MDSAPSLEVSPAAIMAIASRHRLGTSIFARLDHLGKSNTIYLLGEDLVLRVPQAVQPAIARAAFEVVAVAAARAAGVRTPRLIAFDDARDLLPVPYAIYERVPGVSLGTLAIDATAIPNVWRELGHDLALLHTNVRREGPAGQLPDSTTDPDPRPWLDDLARDGLVLADEAAWLRAWLDGLEHYARAPTLPHFCHSDLNASNIMVVPDPPTYQALLDWDGAGWGDVAWDFVPVALAAVPFMLEGYRAVAPLENDDTAEARILWHHIQLALFTLRHGPPRDRPWVARRIARLRESIGAFLATPSAGWIGKQGEGYG